MVPEDDLFFLFNNHNFKLCMTVSKGIKFSAKKGVWTSKEIFLANAASLENSGHCLLYIMTSFIELPKCPLAEQNLEQPAWSQTLS